MRIRRCASKLLGSAHCSTPSPMPPQSQLPPPPPAACGSGCGNGSPATTSRVICELNRSPWDLIAELGLSNPQEDIDDEYFVKITGKESCWLFSSSDVKVEEGIEKQEAVKKVAKKKDAGKKTKVKKQEEVEDRDSEACVIWTCKKNDGKRWHCSRQTSRPNSLCDHHLAQSRSYYNPNYENPSTEASTSVTSSKARKKTAADDADSSNAYYYYAGFGPFRGKRRSRSNVETADAKEETEHQDDYSEARGNESGTPDGELCDIAGIAGGDEESDDDDDSIGCIGNGERRGDGDDNNRAVVKRSYRKRGRKPVKARSLKSFL